MKKAQAEESFKYIFGIIIGAMFLVFFIGFAYQYIDSSSSISDAELANAIDNDLTAFGVSQSAQNVLDYNRDIIVNIDKGMITPEGFTSGKKTDKIIFSKNNLNDKELLIATKSFYMPYKITNFFYIADKNTLYILVYDQGTESFANELLEGYSAIPSNFPVLSFNQKELKEDDISSITREYDSIRFVFLTEQEYQPNLKDYSIIEITTDDSEYNYGEIEFEDGNSIYLGKEMLIGAIVSENKESYDYNLNLALEKLSDITGIYYEKSKFISARMPECEYNAIKTSLNNYKAFIGETTLEYKAYSNSLENANKQLGGDCPEIY